MYEAFGAELGYPVAETLNGMGEILVDCVHDGLINRDRIIDLGEIIAGKKEGRSSPDQIVLFAQGGQPTYDVAWGWECWQKAKELGLGISLNLWESPALLRK